MILAGVAPTLHRVTWLDVLFGAIGGWFDGLFGFVNGWLDGLLALVRSLDPTARILFSGFAMFCETSILLGLIVPGDTTVLISATGTRNAAQYVALLVAVIIGSLGGETLGFGLGRWFGPRIRHSRLGRRIGERTWTRAERYLERRGGVAIFVSRFLPVFHSVIPLTVGMSGMRYRRFLAWTVPACVIWALAYCTVGWIVAGSYLELSGQLRSAGVLFAAVIVAFVLAMWLIRRAIARAEERHMRHEEDEPAR